MNVPVKMNVLLTIQIGERRFAEEEAPGGSANLSVAGALGVALRRALDGMIAPETPELANGVQEARRKFREEVKSWL